MEQRDTRNTVRGSTVNGPVYQADAMHFHGGGSLPGAGLPAELAGVDWAHAVFHSAVWAQVPADRDPSGAVRLHSAAVAARLAAVRDRACAVRGADPWYDPDLAVRFLGRVEWLLGEPPAGGGGLDLYPVEAALFTLAPFLYQAHALDLAAELAPLGPQSLRRQGETAPAGRQSHPGPAEPAPVAAQSPPGPAEPADVPPQSLAQPPQPADVQPRSPRDAAQPGAARRSFEAFAEDYGVLVARAQRRPAAEGEISWWLFHRWLLHSGRFAAPDAIGRLLAEAVPGGEAAATLGGALTPERVGLLVHGLRRGPDVCNPDHLGRLRPDERVRGPGAQRVREQRLCLLLALAYAAAAEPTALPEIVVEHLGIPHPVDLAELHETLAGAEWGGTPELPVLRAACHHEAVIEGLRAYVARADELLLAVARTAAERVAVPVPALPARLSADGLAPARGVFSGWARFQLDERRIRSLLMGVQLYKDPGLAVRELYQNALDACRFRRARSRYLDATTPASYPYEGAISISQDLDENGREYVECRDDGVGMGEAELRGVFSNAGARFPEQADFRQEFATWRENGIDFHPNSRFGIGVLSYFMLADEIRVTTCRMSRTGALGPLLQVSIFGPGHLFRITELAERGSEPGTAVRLYLREGEFTQGSGWSCVAALGRVLGLAEFTTTARDTAGEARWEPGRLRPRVRPDGERMGLDIQHPLAEWSSAPDGVDVVWCAEGGALLVDGLLVEPAVRAGVLSAASGGLYGVVVNLSGALSPARLSADRTLVIDDLSGQVADLLRDAAEELTAGKPPKATYQWICQVAAADPPLADLLTLAVAGRNNAFSHCGAAFDAARVGCFPADVGLLTPDVFSRESYGRGNEIPWSTVLGDPPDHVYLWRLLAHRPNHQLALLSEFCPELDFPHNVLPALPSDHLLVAKRSNDSSYWHWEEGPSNDRSDIDPVQLQRALLLGVAEQQKSPDPSQAEETISVDTLLRYAEDFGAGADEAAEVLRTKGREVSAEVVNVALAAPAEPLLMLRSSETVSYLSPGDVAPMGHIARASVAQCLPVAEICDRLESHGVVCDSGALPPLPSAATVTLLSLDLDGEWPWLDPAEPVLAPHVITAAQALTIPVPEAISTLSELGFTSMPVPADACGEDLIMLNWEEPVEPPPGPVPYGQLIDYAYERDRPLPEVLARMRQFGYEIPLSPPAELDALDQHVLSHESDMDWWSILSGETVPFSRLISAARSLHASPADLANRLSSYGIETTCNDLPPGLTFHMALDLLNIRYNSGHSPRERVSRLSVLTQLTRQMSCSLPQLLAWCHALGVEVPDLPTAIRAALARVPRVE